MKIVKWIGGVLAVYVVFVIAFDGVFLGYFQPQLEATGIPMLVLTTTDDSGEAGDRMLARIEMGDELYVSAHHWPRGWYHKALARPDVRVEIDGEIADYRAVRIEGEEFEQVATAFPLGFVTRFLMGFPPPRDILRLDAVAPWANTLERRPNVLLIVADDLGYADVGFQGVKDIPTPSLDALAASGVRVTNGYVSSTWCSPTRAGLLTGKHQERFGEGGHETAPGQAMSLAETTLAEHLQAAGYVTGLVGKWHLGTEPEYHPMERGFDEFFGFLRGAHTFLPEVPIIIFPDEEGNGVDFGATEARAGLDGQIQRGRAFVQEEAHLTDAFGREAVSFIERHESDPFFLYLSFNAPHMPMQATDELLDKFASTEDPVRRLYNGMTFAIDEAVGAVMAQLRRSNLIDNTLIFFISDNGGPTVLTYAYNASNNAPLRGSKGTALEGGIRVPFVVSWPSVVPAGITFDEPVVQLDIIPTVLAAAGLEPAPNLDGVDILPQLTGMSAAAPHDALYWRSFGQMAVRQGDWKLVTYPTPVDTDEMPHGNPPYRGPLTEPRLYNLRDDIGEENNLADSESARAAELLALWNAWNAELQAAAR